MPRIAILEGPASGGVEIAWATPQTSKPPPANSVHEKTPLSSVTNAKPLAKATLVGATKVPEVKQLGGKVE